jgi:thioredoxin reductase (NADPH)
MFLCLQPTIAQLFYVPLESHKCLVKNRTARFQCLRTENREELPVEGKTSEFDVVILGSGPAGLQAALHAARSKSSVAVLGRMQKSSLYKAHIENYCCMDGTLNGQDVLDQGRRQAEKFGATFLELDVVDVARDQDSRFRVDLENGDVIVACSLILAMGISRNRLNVPGEKQLIGKGVSYCVDCDGNFFRGQTVAVAGEESAAFYGALKLLLIAGEVHLVYNESQVSENLQFQVESSTIHLHPGRKVKSISGEQQVERVVLDNDEVIETEGVFIELGAKGALELATKLDIALDTDLKYVAVNRKQETNVLGAYAAGDLCGPPWQMAKAVGEGCVAGMEAAQYVRHHRMRQD